MLRAKPGSGGLEYFLHATTDTRMRTPVGEISVDPAEPDSFVNPVIY